jgi:hypothetical protein
VWAGGLGACVFGGTLSVFVDDLTGFASISAGDVDIGTCFELEPDGRIDCAIGPFMSGIETFTIPELILLLIVLDPVVVQMPDDITNFAGSYSEAGGAGGMLDITSGLATIDLDAVHTLTAEPGQQLVVIALPPGAPREGNFAFNVNFDFPPGTPSIDVKPIITAKAELTDGTVYYPPLAPCVTDLASAPILTIPLDDSTGGNLDIPVTQDMMCDGQVGDLRPRAAAAPIGAFLCYQTKPTRGDLCSDGSPLNEGAVCASEGDCGGDAATAFCAPNRLPKGLQTTLTDRYETGVVFDVKKSSELCRPATVAGSANPDDATHLKGYATKASRTSPKHVRRTDLRITNAFHPVGELVLDTKKPKALLVPASVSAAGPMAEPDPGLHVVDPFDCYQVRTSKGDPRFPKGLQAMAVDGFGEERIYDLKKPTRLCVPADQDGETPGAEAHPDDLLCYKAKLAKAKPRQQNHAGSSGLFVNDAFGPARSDTRKPKELCVPSRVASSP